MHVHYKVLPWLNWKCSRKILPPASANLTCDFIKTGLHHWHFECSYFLGGGGPAFSQNSSDYLARVLICLKSCSEKFHKFYRLKETWSPFWKTCSFCLFKKNSNTDGFAKFWRTLLNSCFKEIADKGTTEWIERVTINL